MQVTAHERTPDHTGGFLAGVRVIELSAGIAASFCGRLLADAGAEVIKIEPPDGDALRAEGPFAGGAPHPELGLPFLVLNAGKRSVVLDPARAEDRRRLGELVLGADILVENLPAGQLAAWGIDPHALAAAHPALIHATISPFGHEGPYADFAATELTVYALGGLMYHIGAYDREPIKHGPPQAQYLAGLSAADGVLFALLARDRDGRGQHVDVSMQESLTLLLAGREFPLYAFSGAVARREGKAGPGLSNIMACADGYVVPIGGGGAARWETIAQFLEAPELLKLTADGRGGLNASPEVIAFVRERLAVRSRYEVFHGAQALGLPWGLVQSPADLVRCPQLEAHGFWAEVDHPVAGRLRLPGPAYRATRSPARVRAAAPLLGEHTAEVTAAPPPRPAVGAAALHGANGKGGGLPLAGVRVVEAARVWAMPFADGLLTDMGAEVIKIETTGHLDQRVSEPYLHNDPSGRYWEHSAPFHSLNRGKRSTTLNLQTDAGRRLFRELVATADVVVENNRPGVLTRLGLDYAALSQIRPDLIMLSNSGYGQTGPWRRYGAIALSLEPATGLGYFTGYAGGPPVRWGWYTDFPVSLMAVFALTGALHHRARTGQGQYIDLSMYEVGVSLLGERLLEHMVNNHEQPRMGNRHPQQAPHGCYPCAGDDAWVTIAVTDDDAWRRLCREMGRPDLAADARFATTTGRKAHEDELDALIAAWTGDQERYTVMRRLQAVGVAAGAVQTTRDLLSDAQLGFRGFFERVDHGEHNPEIGVRPYISRPWRLSRTPGAVQGPAPLLGEHNTAVLCDLLGLPEETLGVLAQDGVVGDAPAPGLRPPAAVSVEEPLEQGRWAAVYPDFEREMNTVP